MADETNKIARPWAPTGNSLPLSHGVGEDRHLKAHCTVCDRRTVFDPSPWIAERLGGLRMEYFETRLRCLCGARSATLEIWSGPAPTETGGRQIFAFR